MWLSAQSNAWPFELSVFLCEFCDLEKLIPANVGKSLARVGRRPPDLQPQNTSIFSKADMLSQGRCPERTSAPDSAINESLPTSFILSGQRDSCTDRCAIALRSHQSQTDPVIAVSRILIQANRMPVARDCASSFGDHILIAIVVEIGKSHAVSFMKSNRAAIG